MPKTLSDYFPAIAIAGAGWLFDAGSHGAAISLWLIATNVWFARLFFLCFKRMGN